MFGRKAAKIAELERQREALAQQLVALNQQAATPRVDLNTALDTVLVKAVESTATMSERMNQLTVENIKLAADLQAQQMRKVGGKMRARTATRRRDGVFERDCRMCHDPMILDPTPAEILAHANHRPPRRPRTSRNPEPTRAAADRSYRIEDGAVHADASEDEIETASDGTQQIECEDCLNGADHAHR